MFDPVTIIQWLGPYLLAGASLIIFFESVLLGVILPGDALLFTMGLFAATGAIDVSLWLACLLVAIAAILGNICGYWVGAKIGPALFTRPNSKLFKKQQVDNVHRFFDKYGPLAIILARFVPFARTFITLIAGIGRMNLRKYLVYSSIGGLLWAPGMTLLGALLGQIPWVRDNLNTILYLMLAAVMVVSAVPIITEVRKKRREKKPAEAAA
ncbi:VTT domain-containing protein [Nonomuraea angiospora]|uniref:DedA family protein n=1 Tax=Nonomuraea angiospora TaxID=46172 RepID=UPI003437B5BF